MVGPEEAPSQEDHGTATDLPPRLGDDQFYSALAAAHRRRLLYYLLETEESTVDEIATVLTGWEIPPTGTMQTPAERAEIRLQLLHNHLPRLADSGLIAYDRATGTVRLAGLQPRVRELIQQSVEAEQRVASE